MGGSWFGRKSAPDARPFAPAWLSNGSAEEGFARSTDGMSAYIKSSGQRASYRDGAWEILGARLAAIPSPSGGSNVDTEGRAAIDQILDALREHGLIES